MISSYTGAYGMGAASPGLTTSLKVRAACIFLSLALMFFGWLDLGVATSSGQTANVHQGSFGVTSVTSIAQPMGQIGSYCSSYASELKSSSSSSYSDTITELQSASSTISSMTSAIGLVQFLWYASVILLIVSGIMTVARAPYMQYVAYAGLGLSCILALVWINDVGQVSMTIGSVLKSMNISGTVTLSASFAPYVVVISAIVGIAVPLVLDRRPLASV